MTYYTSEQRYHKKLRRMRHDDAREAQRSTPEAIIKEHRAQLTTQLPDATADQIEAELARWLARGSKPTAAVVPPSPGIPQEVRAPRRIKRKRTVAANRQHRR